MERLESAGTSLRDRVLIRLLFRLGCRISEALGIGLEDVDFEQGTITIQHLKTRSRLSCQQCGAHPARILRFCPGCGQASQKAVAQQRHHRRMRRLPVDDYTLDMIKEHAAAGSPVRKDGKLLLFGINRRRGWQIVRDSACRAGLGKLVNPETDQIRNVSPHRLRDAFAVHAMKTDGSGNDLRLLQEHPSHASFNTTARYRRAAGEEHREWYLRLAYHDEEY
jgi:integrase/recombinase XerD